MPQDFSCTLSSDQSGTTLAAFLRGQLPDHSWSQVRRLIATRRVRIGGELCLDPARRLKEGDAVELLERPVAQPPRLDPVAIRYLDEHLVVVEKPSGMSTVRHPSERSWPARRKELEPTLEDLVPPLLAQREGRTRKGPLPRLRIVHRLDKGTSGLVVLARTVVAERELGRQFRRHSVIRRYLAVVTGEVASQRIRSQLVRDRGDGRRGSTTLPGVGKEAITHVEVVERLPGHTLLLCRLETGRTHQIRIHLAELGHPVLGEKVYNRALGAAAVKKGEEKKVQRLALHATELGFRHPVSEQEIHWTMPLPAELERVLGSLRAP